MRYHKVINVAVLLILLLGIATTFIYPQKAEAYAEWYNSSWLYRKSFPVVSTITTTQTNVDLKIMCYYGAGTDTAYIAREPASTNYYADASTSTTLIYDSALPSTVDNYYVGARIYNVTRSLASMVTAYNAATKVLTVSPAITAQASGDAYYIYDIPPVIYFNNKCQTDFDDLRFTANDGTTLQLQYTTTYTSSVSATVWVQFATVYGKPTINTFWVYYGNSTATANNNDLGNSPAHTRLLLHCEGADTSPTFTDEYLHTQTAGGNAQVDTAQFKFGAASGLFDGDSDYVRSASNIDWAYGTAAFTIDCWVRIDAATADGQIIYSHGGSNHDFVIFISATNKYLGIWNSGSYKIIDNVALTDDTWYHVAVVGNGAADGSRNIKMYKNGTQIGATWTVNYNWGQYAATIGMNDDAIPESMNGWIDEFRISKGGQIWTADFTAPTTAYTTDFATLSDGSSAYIGAFTAEVSLGPTPTVSSAKVFRNYIDTGDWLITFLCLNLFNPYYSDGSDVQQLFYAQLYDVAGTTMLAQTKPSAWGYRPGSIYLSPTTITPLTWGSAYRVRIYGNFTPNPYTEYTLQAADWMGDNLILLDAWTRSSAILIENYYGVSLTEYVSGKGLTLNEDGCVIFSDGIPELEKVRPGLFMIVSNSTAQAERMFTQANRPVWQIMWGPYISAALTQFGNTFNANGQTAGALLGFLFYAIVAAVAFPRGSAAAAIGIPFVIMIGVFATGLISMAMLGVILSIAAFILIFQMWLKVS